MPQDSEFRAVSVDAHGNATADHDRVAFSLNTEVVKPTLAAVKAELLARIDNLKKTYAELAQRTDTKLDADTLSTNSTIVKNQLYDRKKEEYVQKGYKGVYVVSFESAAPDEASTIYNALTDLEEFNVLAPQFKLKHQEALKRVALEDAHRRLLERFATECRVIGKDPASYEIATWNVNYGHQDRGGVRAYSAVAGSPKIARVAVDEVEEIEIQASKAVVTVYLTATFVPFTKEVL